MLEPPGPRARAAKAAERQRRCRRRLKLGLARFTADAPEGPLIAALIAAGYLAEAAALDPAMVEQALGTMLTQWAERWRVTP
jgi:hypothetical protein